MKTGDTLTIGYLDNSSQTVITDKMIKDFLVNENYTINLYTLNLILDNMFVYDIGDDDKFFWTEYFEELLRDNGYCAIFKYKTLSDSEIDSKFNEKLICAKVNFIGNLNPYGLLNDAICITENGLEFNFENWIDNNDIVIAENNNQALPDKLQTVTSRILSECNISLRADVVGTRYNKIINVRNNNEKENYKKAIEANESGKPQVIVGDLTILDALNDDTTSISSVTDLTSIKDSDKIQYISKLKDEEMRQFISLYGLMTQGNTKLAQQTVDEVLAYLPLSMVIPISRLEARKKAISEVNKKFNKNWSVKFNKPWEIMYEKLLEIADENVYNDIGVDDFKNIPVDNKKGEQEDKKEEQEEKGDEKSNDDTRLD